MPIYEYSCEHCSHYEEFLEKVGAPSLKKCPACGKRKFKRIISLTSFQLKGDGWYVTDFRDKDKKKPREDGATADSADSKASDSKDKPKENEGKDGKAKDDKAKDGKAKDEKTGAKDAADTPKDKGGRKKAGKAPEAA